MADPPAGFVVDPHALADASGADGGSAGVRFVRFGGSEAMSLGVYVLPAGAEDPQSPHDEDELYVVLSGRGRFALGESVVDVAAGSTIFVPGGADHRFVDIAEELRLLVAFAPARGGPPMVVLTPWTGPWAEDDPDANFKADVAVYAHADPLETLRGMSANVGIPVGALARYVLARWATEGTGGLLELGPRMVERLWAAVEAAEADGSDEARLAAYDTLRQMLSWLRTPLAGDGG